ncbi:hypothetical protein [Nocardia brasiliensis]|uniref:Secreted protein n=1 Tax=Nocardia brasiliensis (strain ATCC 700358 / HUJEG-1) TaxID=1133849 RepID=K0F555_NOCB7|nr:hypothetical protein [Nocardia brasiliensis]AFU04415.1 hypothetical protein O3I_032330 [Nocardia brasiliensis ATCC 700358]OCF91495.1 hypothetical protein AW168_06970 [Nocardia brasiliensis]
MTVRRLVVRSSVAAALALGSIAVVAPHAAADTCSDGTARIFFANAEPACVTGTTSYRTQTIAKVCSMPGADVVAEATFPKLRGKAVTQRLELTNGTCGRFEIMTQESATVSVTQN